MNTGELAIERLFTEFLQCDPEWSARKEKSFTWWPAQQAQTVGIVKEAPGPGGETGYVISIRTDFLQNVKNDDKKTEEYLAGLMRQLVMAAPFWFKERQEIYLLTKMTVHGDNLEWAVRLLSQAALYQAHQVQTQTGTAAKIIGATAKTSGPKPGPIRPDICSLIKLPETFFQEEGQGPSRWKEDEFEETAKKYMQGFPCLEANSGGLGVTGEFIHGEMSSLLRMVADQPHPRYGNGLLVTHTFPTGSYTEKEFFELANNLNTIEIVEGPWGYVFGSFYAENSTLQHRTFIPNSAYQKGLLPNFYFGSAMRAKEVCKKITDVDWNKETYDRSMKNKMMLLSQVVENMKPKNRFRFKP